MSQPITIQELVKQASREDLEKRILAGFELNQELLNILHVLTSDISTGTDRREARERAQELFKAINQTEIITKDAA